MSKKAKIGCAAVGGMLLLFIIMGIVFSVLHQKSQQIIHLTGEQMLEDYEYLCDVLDTSYPFWQEVADAGIQKEAVYEAYRDNIENSRTDIEFMKQVGYFLKEFQGFGHLSALDGYMYQMYMDTLSDGGGLLSDEEQRRVRPLIDALTNSTSVSTYSLLDHSHAGFRSTIGLKDAYRDDAQETESGENAAGIATDILNDGKTAYIQIPSFVLTSMEADKAVLSRFFREINALPDMIIDIRGNSGGSDLYWKQLLVEQQAKTGLAATRYFLFNPSIGTQGYVSANFASDRVRDISALSHMPWFDVYSQRFSSYILDELSFDPGRQPYSGNVWLLVDHAVYSASENFAMFCKNSGFARLVGSPTGGDGGIADPVLMVLPNSGLIVRFSMFYGLNADGTGNEAVGTIPDTVIADGEDALDICLSLIK